MPCPHFAVSIVKRSRGQSAVAASAYQSGEKLFCQSDHKQKYYSHKKEIVWSDVLLPENAPLIYKDRNTLWNSVEQIEKRYDAQLARRIIIALPREIPRDSQITLIRTFCLEQFVSKGMIADVAVHDRDGDNPHAHILLTMRALDNEGKWLPKSRMIYELDETGEKLRTASGNLKSHKENTTDWDKHENVKLWRNAWEQAVNQRYHHHGLPFTVSLSSLKEQGDSRLPTVHMGPAASQMEKRGIRTNRGNLNRDIRSYNSQLYRLKKDAQTISDRLEKLLSLQKEAALAIFPEDKPRTLSQLLWDYMDIRSDARKSVSRYAQRKADVRDLQAIAGICNWLTQENITSVDEFNTRFREAEAEVNRLNTQSEGMAKRIRALETAILHKHNLESYKPLFEKYSAIFFPARKERFECEHIRELDAYRLAVRYFKANPDKAGLSAKELISRKKKLQTEITESSDESKSISDRIRHFEQISYWLSQATAKKPLPNIREVETPDRSPEKITPKKRRNEPSL